MVRVKRRPNRRLAALGLILSIGLIGGASGVIKLTAHDQEPAPASSEEVTEPVERGHKAESLAVPHPVPERGHQGGDRNI